MPRPAPRKKAIRPRDAATLVLVRRDASGPTVLMGQRHAGHVFMPSKFVFPGGRVDRGDAQVLPARGYRPDVEARLRVRCVPTRVRALGMAALRETFEETGLLVGRREPPARPTRSPSWKAFLSHGVTPSLDRLEFVARAITPPGSPRRFDARFFMADAEQIQGDLHDELAGDGELLDLSWVPLADAQELDLPEVTHLVIDEVRKRVDAGPDGARIRAPFFRWQGRKPFVEHL